MLHLRVHILAVINNHINALSNILKIRFFLTLFIEECFVPRLFDFEPLVMEKKTEM